MATSHGICLIWSNGDGHDDDDNDDDDQQIKIDKFQALLCLASRVWQSS